MSEETVTHPTRSAKVIEDEARFFRQNAMREAVELCKYRPDSLDSETVIQVADQICAYLMHGKVPS